MIKLHETAFELCSLAAEYNLMSFWAAHPELTTISVTVDESTGNSEINDYESKAVTDFKPPQSLWELNYENVIGALYTNKWIDYKLYNTYTDFRGDWEYTYIFERPEDPEQQLRDAEKSIRELLTNFLEINVEDRKNC